MTAFEMASTVARHNNIRTFKREMIKIAHNKAVETLVSVYFNIFNREQRVILNRILNFVFKKAFRQNQESLKVTKFIIYTNKR
jgi:hypothetical protein